MSESIEEKEVTFEEAMEQLERIVDQLEEGEVPLEEAIKLFKNGMELSKSCHNKLAHVEKQVNLLMEEEGQLVKKEFQLEEDPS